MTREAGPAPYCACGHPTRVGRAIVYGSSSASLWKGHCDACIILGCSKQLKRKGYPARDCPSGRGRVENRGVER